MKKYFLQILFCLLLQHTASAQYSIDTTATVLQMAQSLVGNNISISNISYTGAFNAKGLFTDTTNNYYFQHGVILSSGSVILPPFNTIGNMTTSQGTLGDMALNNITGKTTFDAASLEFDFTGASDTVIFNYVFASEEYPEWVNSQFNDVFALLVSEPGIATNINVALIPDTLLPVTINNVNNGHSNAGPCVNCNFYDNHWFGASSFVYDGSTKILTAKIPVTALKTYHLKFFIADASDRLWDSAILIEASSFSAPAGLRQYVKGIAKSNEMICVGDSLQLTATKAINYNWNTGDSTQNIYVKQAGNYFYSVHNNSTSVSSSTFALALDSLHVNCNLLSINKSNNFSHLFIYPNPATTTLFIESIDSRGQSAIVKIYDIHGKLKISKSFQSISGKNKFEIPLENLSKGMYLLELRQGENSFRKKFAVQ